MRKSRDIKLYLVIFFTLGFFSQFLTPSLANEDLNRRAKSLAAYTLGVIYDLQGFPEKAIDEYEKAAEMEDHSAIHLRLGADFARLGKLDQAIVHLQQVLEKDSSNIQARYLLGLIYFTEKQYDKAAQQYEIILQSLAQIEPENIEIYSNLAQLYYSQKDYEKAIHQFEKILSIEPSNVDILYLLGSLYVELNKRDQAIELFTKAIKIDPDHDGILNSLGYLYAEDGINLDEAQSLIERALKLNPENGAYLDSLGWVYFKKGQYEQALKYLKQADNYLKDPVIYEHIGDVYFQLNKTEGAKKYWSLSLELFPDQERVVNKLKLLKQN